jgi:hypothetical protein
VQSVGYVILYVRDLDVSAAFDRDVVGLSFKLRDAGYAEFVTGETRLGLLERTRASDLIHCAAHRGRAGRRGPLPRRRRLANVPALAASVRLPVRVVLGFADAEDSALLGLEEQREFPLCLVAIGASDSEIPPAAKAPEEVSFSVLPFSRTRLASQPTAAYATASAAQGEWRPPVHAQRRATRSSLVTRFRGHHEGGTTNDR